MQATEKTPLRALRVLKYHPLQLSGDLDRENSDNKGSTTVKLFADAKTDKKKNVARNIAITLFLLSICLIYLSVKTTSISEPDVTPVTPDHNKKKPTLPVLKPVKPVKPVVPIEKAAWSAIAQPLSILNPESLGFLAIDRPPISMPGLIFGELLEKNVALPTNSWCENLFLGSSNTESTNRVYQVPYVIDTEVHGNASTQGVETHPAHVQANEKMVEVQRCYTPVKVNHQLLFDGSKTSFTPYSVNYTPYFR
jgi:hypothetical protein